MQIRLEGTSEELLEVLHALPGATALETNAIELSNEVESVAGGLRAGR